MDPDELRRRLHRILENTKTSRISSVGALRPGDAAGQRETYDNLHSGRLYWAGAKENAEDGIQALDEADMEKADLHLWVATDFYIAALESCIRPSDVAELGRKIKKRGRPR